MRENVMRRTKRSVKNVLVEALQALGRSGGSALAAAFVVVSAPIEHAGAQGYPSRSITVIVPYPAGGPADAVGRIMVEGMRKSLGQPVIVENVAGASGSVGVGRVARAAPDGYTLILGNWAANALNGAIFTLSYDLMNDFAPVSWLANEPQFIVAKKSMPANNLKELVAWLKANPDKATWGTAGPGGVAHVVGVFFQRQTGTRFQFVPYRGLGPAMQDLIAGQIDLSLPTAAIAAPQARRGAIKAYAVTAKTRSEAAPEIPTTDEAGLTSFYATNWHGLWGPKGTPRDVIAKVNAAVVQTLADATVRSRLADLGLQITSREQQTPEALAAFQKAEIEKWWPIIKEAGIRAE
jgi:tripartite-type tricarboxylate transporter receptor subunit TctC